MLLIAVLTLSTVPALAWASNGAKMGYVRVQYLIDNSPQAKEASSKLQKEFRPKKEELQQKKKELQRLQQKLQKEGLTLSDDKRKQLEDRAQRLQREIKRSQKTLQQELNIQRNDAFKGVRQSVQKAVQTVAENEGYDLVVGQGALYASDAIDITQKVLERMEQQYQAEQQSQ
jgi:outer membrane protein